MGNVLLQGVSPFDLPGVFKIEITTYGSRVVLNLRLPGGAESGEDTLLTVPLRAVTALNLSRDLAVALENSDKAEAGQRTKAGHVLLEGLSPFDLPGVLNVAITTFGGGVVLNLRLPGERIPENLVITVPLPTTAAQELSRELAGAVEDLDQAEKM